jgi:hypothetical protein
MKNIIRAVLIAAIALPAFAQYAPPARDLTDVARLTGEFQRLIGPALAEVSAWSEALTLMASVQQTLKDEPAPLIAVDKANDKLDAFMRKHERDDPPLPKDIVRFVKLVHTWLDDVRMGPPPTDLTELRVRVHLQVIHPMQRMVLQQATLMQQVERNLQSLAASFDTRIVGSITSAAAASPAGTTP